MTKSLVGQIVNHEGKAYQILTDKGTILLASSYGIDCGIEETIFVSRQSGSVIAKKSVYIKSNTEGSEK